MIDKAELAKKAGISPRTLNRNVQLGIIPKGFKNPKDPKDRKVYWENWVLDKLKRIVEIQQQGHRLKTALQLYERERVENLLTQLENIPSAIESLGKGSVRFKNGTEMSLLDVCLAYVIADFKRIVADRKIHAMIVTQLKKDRIVDLAFHMINAGFNPILTWDGEKLNVTADFAVSHCLANRVEERSPMLVIPLYVAMHSVFKTVGKDLPLRPNVRPVAKVKVQREDETIQYDIRPGGIIGFQIDKNSAEIIPK